MSSLGAPLDRWSLISTRTNSDYATKNDPVENALITFTEEGDLQSLSTIVRFHRSHPAFKWFLLFNLVMVIVLAFTATQIVAAHSPTVTTSLLRSSGAKAMNADELIQSVTSNGRPVFWLNQISGDMYSQVSTEDGIDVVSYLPENSSAPYLDNLDLVIKTYRNADIYNSQLRPLEATANSTAEMLAGIKVSYNPASLDHSIVHFNNRPEIVVIQYPAIQNVETLINDAQSLVPIN